MYILNEYKWVVTCLWTSFFFTIFFCSQLIAQNSMRIHQKDGAYWDVPIGQIDSITYVNSLADTTKTVVKELTGSWLWGNVEQGYYELLTFNEDMTYTGYDNYFSYGFDTMTYGFYSQYGTMLTLWSNGFGYNRRYNWYIMDLTENALEVMTKMGPFTYFRLQSEVIRMKVNESIECKGDDAFVFADGTVVSIEDNKLYGISQGTTYIQKKILESGLIYAYKVIVE